MDNALREGFTYLYFCFGVGEGGSGFRLEGLGL